MRPPQELKFDEVIVDPLDVASKEYWSEIFIAVLKSEPEGAARIGFSNAMFEYQVLEALAIPLRPSPYVLVYRWHSAISVPYGRYSKLLATLPFSSWTPVM